MLTVKTQLQPQYDLSLFFLHLQVVYGGEPKVIDREYHISVF